MMKKLLFILNPRSGKGQIKNNLLGIVDTFIKNNYETTLHITQDILDAKNKVISDGEKYNLIVCSGGDGTLNETLSGIMEAGLDIPLGYIPAGSTNDFAASLRLPKNMHKAAEIATGKKTFLCDVGMFNDRYFAYVAAFGAFTEVSYATPQQMKNVLGHPAYIIEGIKKLTSIKSAKISVRYDGNIIEGDFIYGMITNSISVGGFKKLVGKSVYMDDGLFEVTLIRRPKNPLELQEIMAAILMEEMTSNNMYTFKASKLEIHSPEEVPWVLDGEYGGVPKQIIIRNLHQAIKIMHI